MALGRGRVKLMTSGAVTMTGEPLSGREAAACAAARRCAGARDLDRVHPGVCANMAIVHIIHPHEQPEM
jgi:hypothetical protein